jgi:hypothetical protein
LTSTYTELLEGSSRGLHRVGFIVGIMVGDSVGDSVGVPVGDRVGTRVGTNVGEIVGDIVGLIVGSMVGVPVGDPVGTPVGAPVGAPVSPGTTVFGTFVLLGAFVVDGMIVGNPAAPTLVGRAVTPGGRGAGDGLASELNEEGPTVALGPLGAGDGEFEDLLGPRVVTFEGTVVLACDGAGEAAPIVGALEGAADAATFVGAGDAPATVGATERLLDGALEGLAEALMTFCDGALDGT